MQKPLACAGFLMEKGWKLTARSATRGWNDAGRIARQIDVLDRQLVELLSERARAAQDDRPPEGCHALPVYEPAREKVIYANVRAANKGPLPDIELTHIYERIIDVMRALQRDELASERNAQAAPRQVFVGPRHWR
jgi:chorismate mutase